ncbi:MAG: hypothetical protein Q8T11_11030 [Elusimicrobiota bacterium]|nr:hypothetical protein [Elusimicrobiota bacterium]
MGPGLFLALALLAPAGRAETAAGLDAQGVDPRAAVENKWGLDVRDAAGRPVSREQVLSDLKGAAVKRAADNSFSSNLPRARAVLAALELVNDFADAFRMAAAGFALAKILPGLPGGAPKISVLWLLLAACVPMTFAFCCRPSTVLTLSRSRQSSIEVLRC